MAAQDAGAAARAKHNFHAGLAGIKWDSAGQCRACAERCCDQETPLLTPTLSSPGRKGESDGAACVPPPPFGGRRSWAVAAGIQSGDGASKHDLHADSRSCAELASFCKNAIPPPTLFGPVLSRTPLPLALIRRLVATTPPFCRNAKRLLGSWAPRMTSAPWCGFNTDGANAPVRHPFLLSNSDLSLDDARIRIDRNG